MGSTNKLLESANRDIAVKESQLEFHAQQHLGIGKSDSDLKASRAKMLEERAANENAIKSVKEELDEKAKRLNSSTFTMTQAHPHF